MIPTDVSGKWVAVETAREIETRAILNMGAKIEELEKALASANYRILELEQQIYGSK
jgi:hypothetical protein